jgi:hypothetical protein
MRKKLSLILAVMIIACLAFPLNSFALTDGLHVSSNCDGLGGFYPLTWDENQKEFHDYVSSINSDNVKVRFYFNAENQDKKFTLYSVDKDTINLSPVTVGEGVVSDPYTFKRGMNEFILTTFYNVDEDTKTYPIKLYKVRDRDNYKTPLITVTNGETVLYSGSIQHGIPDGSLRNGIIVDNSITSASIQIYANDLGLDSWVKHKVEFNNDNVISSGLTSGAIITQENIELTDGDNDFRYVSEYNVWGIAIARNDSTFTIIRKTADTGNPNPPDGGTGGGGGGSTTTPPVDTTIDPITNAVVVSVSETQLASLFAMLEDRPDEIKLAIIRIPTVAGLDKYGIQLPVTAFTASNSTGIRLETDIGSLTLMDTMLQNTINAQNVKFNMEYVDKTALDEGIQNTIGNHPIISLNMELDGETTEWNNPDSPVIVSVPYTPTPEELANPELITVYYIDGLGNLNAIPNATYDSTNECMVFTTTHFSDYAVAYSNKTFADITDGNIKNAVEVLAAKGIVNGKTETEFKPNDTVTRAEFITMLARAFEFNKAFENIFTDMDSSKYYFKPVGMAKEMGVINGVGNNRFDPNGTLNKGQIEIIINNFRKIGKLNIDDVTLMSLLSKVDKANRGECAVLIYDLIR